MSLNQVPLQVAKVMDPRMNIDQTKIYCAVKGSLVNSWQQFPATNLSNSNVQITANPPNRNVAVSRLIFKKNSYSIVVGGTNTSGGPLLNPGYFGPRAYPIVSTTSAEQITVNNSTFVQSPMSQYWPSLLWYHNNHHNRFAQYSLTPSMLDQFQNYTDGTGTVRNPLAAYGDNSYENTRGGYAGLVIAPGGNPNGGTSVTLTLTVTEPMFLSPFVFGEHSNCASAMIGVQNISYTANYGNLARLLSLTPDQGTGGTVNITSIAVTLNAAALLFEYLTPDPLMHIPRSLETSYFSIVSYPTSLGTNIAQNGTCSITMNSVQVTSIPKRLYIFARQDDSKQSAFTSDSYFSLRSDVNPLVMTWNNQQFFSQASCQDLYNISIKNGSQMSFSQFTNFTGSVLCLEFGTDIGLMSDESAGVLGNYQLGLTAQFVNTSSVTINPTLYVVIVYEGAVTIYDGNASQMIGVLSRQDVLDAKMSPEITYKKQNDVYGGTFFSRLKGLAQRGNDFLKRTKLLSRTLGVLPYTKVGAVAADALGYGVSGGRRLRGAGLTNKQIKNKITARDLASDEENEENEDSGSEQE